MPEQPMICLTVLDLFVALGLVGVAVALAALIYNFIRYRIFW